MRCDSNGISRKVREPLAGSAYVSVTRWSRLAMVAGLVLQSTPGGPHLPPSPLPLPRCGRGRGRVSVAVAILRRSLSTRPFLPTSLPRSRAAGEEGGGWGERKNAGNHSRNGYTATVRAQRDIWVFDQALRVLGCVSHAQRQARISAEGVLRARQAPTPFTMLSGKCS